MRDKVFLWKIEQDVFILNDGYGIYLREEPLNDFSRDLFSPFLDITEA